jgi:hypothetical protein
MARHKSPRQEPRKGGLAPTHSAFAKNLAKILHVPESVAGYGYVDGIVIATQENEATTVGGGGGAAAGRVGAHPEPLAVDLDIAAGGGEARALVMVVLLLLLLLLDNRR